MMISCSENRDWDLSVLHTYTTHWSGIFSLLVRYVMYKVSMFPRQNNSAVSLAVFLHLHLLSVPQPLLQVCGL